MQFAQTERRPTPLPACKFTLMKMYNSFFCGRTTQNELKIQKGMTWWPIFSKKVTFQKSKICLYKIYRPNSQFLFTFPLGIPQGITYPKNRKF